MVSLKDLCNPAFLLFHLPGPALFLYALFWLLQTQVFLLDATPTIGTVVYTRDSNSEEPGKTSFNYVVQGQETAVNLSTSAHYVRGANVELLLGKNEEVRISSFTELYYENIACFLVAVILAFPWWIQMFLWLRERSIARR